MTAEEAMSEIKDAIEFYDARKWDWMPVVAFLAAKASGGWPPPVIRTRIGSGRPRRQPVQAAERKEGT